MKRISVFLCFLIFIGCAAPQPIKKLSRIERRFYNDLLTAFNEAEEGYTKSRETFIQRDLKYKEMELNRADRERIGVILANFKEKTEGKVIDEAVVRETLEELDKLTRDKLDGLKQYRQERVEEHGPIILAFKEIQKALLLVIDNQDKIDGYVQNRSTQLFNIEEMKETTKNLEAIADALIKLERERQKE